MSIIRSTSERIEGQSRRSNQSSTLEDVNVVIASRTAAIARRGRAHQQGTHSDRHQHPSSSATRDPSMGGMGVPELNSQQATFLAGASAAQAFHAASVAEQATQMADHFQRETREIRDMAHQREIQLTQVAAGLRNEAEQFVHREISTREQELLRERAMLQSQLESALASRTELLEAQAQREIANRTQKIESEARQWASSATAQHQTDLERMRVEAMAAIADVQRSRDDEIRRLEIAFAKQLAAQQPQSVDAVHVPIPKTGSGLSTPQAAPNINPFGTPSSNFGEGSRPLSIPVSFGPDPVVAIETPPGLGPLETPPPLPSASIVLSQPATPKAQRASSSVAGQQALGPGGQILGDEGIRVLSEIPKDDKGFAFMSAVVEVLGETLDQTSASASQQDRNRITQLFRSKMDSAMSHLQQAYPPATSSACVPIAAPKAPPYLEGAAASAPPPVSFLPAGMPPLPIQGNVSPVRGRPVHQSNQEGIRGRSGSSESSSPSLRTPPPNVSPLSHLGNAAASSGLLPPGATCRVCGGQHDEINCPYLTMNQQPVEAAPSHVSVGTRNYADEEDPLGLSLCQILHYPIRQRMQRKLGVI